MARQVRTSVTLGTVYADRLAVLAEQAHMRPSTFARLLLSQAIDAADSQDVVERLDGISGAFERAERGVAEIKAGLGIPLRDL